MVVRKAESVLINSPREIKYMLATLCSKPAATKALIRSRVARTVNDICKRRRPRLVSPSLMRAKHQYSWAQTLFPLLPAEDSHELGLDHAAEDISPGNHSHQFSSSHDRHSNDVMSGHLGDHCFD